MWLLLRGAPPRSPTVLKRRGNQSILAAATVTACYDGVAQQGTGKDEADEDGGDVAEGWAKKVGK
jgi:hypothetical protein